MTDLAANLIFEKKQTQFMTKFELTKHFEIVAEINQSFLDSNFMID